MRNLILALILIFAFFADTAVVKSSAEENPDPSTRATAFAVGFAQDSAPRAEMEDAADLPAGLHKPKTQEPELYVGMPKEELYAIYTPQHLKGTREDGRKEWLMFEDWKATEPGYSIIFALEDGKVIWWDKEELPEEPADRLEAIMARQKYPDSAIHASDKSREQKIQSKQSKRKGAVKRSTRTGKYYDRRHGRD